MSHKYRAAIGRESSRPASRGITTQLEPRRRNRLRFRLPREAKRKKQLLHTFVCLQKYVACRVSGKRILSMVWQPNLSQVCGAAMFSTILHGCRAAPPFGLSPKRGQKRFFPSIRRPRRMSRPLPTGSDRLPPKAACCKPVHARSPAVSGRLFCRLPPVGRQYSGVGRPIFSR